MIQLQISTNSKNSILEVKDFLLKSRYASTVEVDWERNRYTLDHTDESQKVQKLYCITKSSLFNKIKDEVIKLLPFETIEILGTPVVYFSDNILKSIPDEEGEDATFVEKEHSLAS